jgi:hypothetical protein
MLQKLNVVRELMNGFEFLKILIDIKLNLEKLFFIVFLDYLTKLDDSEVFISIFV